MEAILQSGSLLRENEDEVLSLRYDFQVPTWKKVKGKDMLSGSELKRLVYRNVVGVDDWDDPKNPIYNRDINKLAHEFLDFAKRRIIKELNIPREFQDMVKFKGISYMKHHHAEKPSPADVHWI